METDVDPNLVFTALSPGCNHFSVIASYEGYEDVYGCNHPKGHYECDINFCLLIERVRKELNNALKTNSES